MRFRGQPEPFGRVVAQDHNTAVPLGIGGNRFQRVRHAVLPDTLSHLATP
jgi:hypothetical protein